MKRAAVKAKEIEFRPVRPGLRELAPVTFLGAMLAILLWQTVVNGARFSPWGLGGLIVLVAGGIFMMVRHRFPGSPVLKVDADGMRYIRFGRPRAIAWRDIWAIETDFMLNELRFIPVPVSRPIAMYREMVSADGASFTMVMEDYWESPQNDH